MTPLAHRIVKELTLPKRARIFVDQAGIFSSLDDIHCFDATEVLELSSNFAEKIREDQQKKGKLSVDQTCFLPAPKTWIEWAYADRAREGVLMVERRRDDQMWAECFWARQDDRQFCSASKGGFLWLSGLTEEAALQSKFALPRLIEGESEAQQLGWCFWLYATLALINTPRTIGRRQHMLHRGLEKRLTAAMRPQGRFPLRAWTEILLRVTPPQDVSGEPSTEAHLTGERALHFCRSHLRVRLGRLEVVRAHWRGDASLGIKQSRYRVAA